MIVKKFMSLILGVSLIKAVSGASISNVFVERETSPTRYYPYSPPYGYTSAASPYYSQSNALSGSVPVYTDPCVSPCVPGQTLAAVRPSANIITHNSPYATIPVVGSPNEETNGYQYSYIVYDENTGDHKAQHELSDGSVVRGEYSFIQPNGYVRKVQYVADDLKGFNAVVKNYVPIALGDTSQFEIKHNEHGPPCHDEKKASLKNPLAEELGDHSEKYTPDVEPHGQTHNNNEPGHELEIPFSHKHKHNKDHNVSGKSRKGDLEDSQERLKESKNLEKASVESIEHLDEESSQEKHKNKSKHQEKSEEVNQGNSDNRHKKSSSEESHDKHQEKNKKKSNEQSTEDFQDSVNKSAKKHKISAKKESKEESSESSEESKEDLIETYKKPKTESTESLRTHKIKTKKVSKEKSSESESIEDPKETTNVHIKHKEAHDLVMSAHKVFVPYYDVIRCLQASLRKSERGPAALSEEPSPLTYLVLNKPC